MKKILQALGILLFIICSNNTIAQPSTISDDKDWSAQVVFLKNTTEAAYIIRIGDIDNLGFGWPDNFDPFCGRMTDTHGYPWEVNNADLPGFDRILLSSLYKTSREQVCGSDGYSNAYNATTSKPVTYSIPTDNLKDVTISNAYLQIFIDDFQSPSLCSRFQVTLNNKRFTEAERIINAIDQTGPVGKLITIPLPEDYYTDINTQPFIKLYIDDIKGSGDGFAIDFIRLLINRKRENTCKGSFSGRVLEKNTEQAISGAMVGLADKTTVTTDGEGRFTMKEIPTGFEVVSASATGYNEGYTTADIGKGEDNPEITIYLEKGKKAVFDKKNIIVGQAVTLENILFDQGKALLKPGSKPVLENVIAFLKANPGAEIELSGHTSAEGEAAMNRSLSYRRVKACKDFIIAGGIDAGRVTASGYGSDRPVAPNDTEVNRALNRRVEMRLLKL